MAAAGGRGFGIIGIGTIAEFHAKAIQAMEGGYLAAAYEPIAVSRAEKFSKDFGVPVFTGKIEEFLSAKGVDVVTIATPSGTHMEPAVAAANHGKHVICEKPLDVTLERCDAMINACRENKVMLAGVFQSRSLAAVKTVKAALVEGRFGKIVFCGALIPWWREQAYYDAGGWRGTWKLDGGGALMNQSIHNLDLLQYLGGQVAEVVGFAGCLAHNRIEVEDTGVAALRFQSGALGVLMGSTACFPGEAAEVWISGDRGTAKLRGGYLASWQFNQEQPEDALRRIDLAPPAGLQSGAGDPKAISFDGHQRQFENFVRALNGKEPLLVDGTEARKSVELILAVYESALTAKAVKLPLRKTPERAKFQ
ncbi:MAG TPA: Gfo/Idh/MocA family oxidoreductase [Planctomycetota bacterium]